MKEFPSELRHLQFIYHRKTLYSINGITEHVELIMWLLGFLTFYILISEDKELTLTFIRIKNILCNLRMKKHSM